MADLEALETWLSPLLQKLDGRGRAQLARKAAQQLRRSQQLRIRAQVNPDGSPYVPRKPRELRGKKGRMFRKILLARFLKAKSTHQQVTIGFFGRVSRIARTHQMGLNDRAESGAPIVKYSRRELLGITKTDIQLLRNSIIDQMENRQTH